MTAPQPGPVIDTHGHLLVPAVSALAADHPAEAANAAAERASFSAASAAATQAQIKRGYQILKFRIYPSRTSAVSP